MEAPFAPLLKAPLPVQVLTVIGGLLVARLALQLTAGFYRFFLRPAKTTRRFGQWGIVTGATDGIGKALAMELARKNVDIVLMSRTLKRLEEVQQEIIAKYPKVRVKILAVDFNQIDNPSVRAEIAKVIEEVIDVGVLFNNVGVSYDFPQYFDQLPDDRVDSLIKLNIAATTVMTRLVLPGMIQRKRGVIVNVSSGSGSICVPLLSQYSATKRYVEQFTFCLAEEYKQKNVHIQCQVPMFVSTKLAKIRHSSFLVPSPATYARAAVAQLGYETLAAPYWPHELQLWVYHNAPVWLMSKMAAMTHLSLRKRALKKLEQKKND